MSDKLSNSTLGDRLRRYSNRAGGPDACWEWQRARHKLGYGEMRWLGKKGAAHRFSWMDANGRPVPPGMVVMHSCDNRACVNPRHLELGTQRENIADMNAKGRHGPCIGCTNGSAKLHPDDIRAIRADHRSLKKIAADYGVSFSTIGRVKRRAIWSHLP